MGELTVSKSQCELIYNSIIMDFHIKLEHNIVHKIRLIFKGYILVMYPCVAFIVALVVTAIVALVAGATAATVSVPPVPPVAAVATGAVVAAVTAGASVAAGV